VTTDAGTAKPVTNRCLIRFCFLFFSIEKKNTIKKKYAKVWRMALLTRKEEHHITWFREVGGDYQYLSF